MSIPVEVTANAASSDVSLNGFNANFSANDAGTTADGSGSEFTYAKEPLAVIDATNDDGGTVNGKTGGTAINNIIANDTLGSIAAVLGEDVSITNVTNDTPLLVNTATTGTVIVPQNTVAGTYMETYTLCEAANINNCDNATITVIVTAAPIVAVDDIKGSFNGVAGGIAIADITDNDTLNGSIVLSGDVNITTVSNATPLIVNKTTGEVSVPADTPADTYVETYMICENLNPSNCDTAIITVVVEDAIPDYIPTLYAQGTIVTGAQGALDLVVRIGEFQDGVNFLDDLMFTIVKNVSLVLDFNPNEMSRQGKMMQNNLWELRETTGLYIFTYKGNSRMFPKSTASRVGLSGTFISPSSAKGAFGLDITIVGGTGEEILGNNKDTDVLEYNNL